MTAPEPIKRALTPATLEMVGRQIIRTGDHLVRIRVDGGRIVLDPVGDWDVHGSYDAVDVDLPRALRRAVPYHHGARADP